VPAIDSLVLGGYSISWQGQDGPQHATSFTVEFCSDRELVLSCRRRIPEGGMIHVEARDSSMQGDFVVRECMRRGLAYSIRAESVTEPNHTSPGGDTDFEGTDFYEILQINPSADPETIHRVFRIMAARFHPDNPETGNEQKFLELSLAHAVLSNPERRAEYDEFRKLRAEDPIAVFKHKEFVVGVEAEQNRRLGVLSLLYNHRRVDPDHPGVSLLELEQKMDLPREHLSFAMWYLRSKQLVTLADNSDYALTAEGADFLEKDAGNNEILASLLTRGNSMVPANPAARTAMNRIAAPATE